MLKLISRVILSSYLNKLGPSSPTGEYGKARFGKQQKRTCKISDLSHRGTRVFATALYVLYIHLSTRLLIDNVNVLS